MISTDHINRYSWVRWVPPFEFPLVFTNLRFMDLIPVPVGRLGFWVSFTDLKQAGETQGYQLMISFFDHWFLQFINDWSALDCSTSRFVWVSRWGMLLASTYCCLLLDRTNQHGHRPCIHLNCTNSKSNSKELVLITTDTTVVFESIQLDTLLRDISSCWSLRYPVQRIHQLLDDGV